MVSKVYEPQEARIGCSKKVVPRSGDGACSDGTNDFAAPGTSFLYTTAVTARRVVDGGAGVGLWFGAVGQAPEGRPPRFQSSVCPPWRPT